MGERKRKCWWLTIPAPALKASAVCHVFRNADPRAVGGAQSGNAGVRAMSQRQPFWQPEFAEGRSANAIATPSGTWRLDPLPPTVARVHGLFHRAHGLPSLTSPALALVDPSLFLGSCRRLRGRFLLVHGDVAIWCMAKSASIHSSEPAPMPLFTERASISRLRSASIMPMNSVLVSAPVLAACPPAFVRAGRKSCRPRRPRSAILLPSVSHERAHARECGGRRSRDEAGELILRR